MAAGGAFLLLLMLLPGVVVGVIVSSANGDPLEGLIVGTRVTAWALFVVVVWTAVGLAVHLSRTRAYRQGYRDGVPASYWFLSSAATLHRSGGGGFAFVLAQARHVVPTGATIPRPGLLPPRRAPPTATAPLSPEYGPHRGSAHAPRVRMPALCIKAPGGEGAKRLFLKAAMRNLVFCPSSRC